MCVTGLVAALLLLQPLLCLISCSFTQGTLHYLPTEAVHELERATAAEGEGSFAFFCELPAAPAAETHFLPAFWPGMLPLLLLAVASSLLLLRLPLARPEPPRACRWAPPLPPPRLLAA
jgi:hypothetical protein